MIFKATAIESLFFKDRCCYCWGLKFTIGSTIETMNTSSLFNTGQVGISSSFDANPDFPIILASNMFIRCKYYSSSNPSFLT